MPITFPFPVRVSVGLVVAGVEQLRKFPGDLPTLGVTAAGQAMRLSMRVQQEFADLATKGDEVLSRIGGQPAEHPAWATFDDEDGDAAGAVNTVVAAVPDVDSAASAAADEDADGDGYAGDASQELAEVIALDLVAAAHHAHHAEADADSPIDADVDQVAADPIPADPTPADPTPADLSQADVSTADPAQADAPTDPTELGADEDAPAVIGSTTNGEAHGPTDDDAHSPDDYESLTLAELRGTLRRLSADQVTELLGRERAGADRPAFVTLLSNRLTSMEQGHP